MEPDPEDFGSFASGVRPITIGVRTLVVQGRPLAILNNMKVERGSLGQILMVGTPPPHTRGGIGWLRSNS